VTVRFVLPPPPADLAERLAAGAAVAWFEDVVIPTYAPGAPEPLPIFSESRVYQGSSGRVYPMPFIESINHEKAPRSWQAVHLENRWVRLMVLPELGGRIHIGFDKVAGYDFIFRNNVIKPALVGLAGPWISGGVEFNWPQHHRPATYMPVSAEIEPAADGSVTVWCTDHDPFTRMRASHGIRLRPDRATIEVRVRLHNRTEDRQTFLWWANVAARSHEQYQAFFPPDVHFVADHARRAITAFPRADRPYYGVDYPSRVDADHPNADRLDYYANITVPSSYMVTSTRDSFFGGYDHRAEAGFVHWADRRIAPGKKLWTWGNAPFGHAWDRQLTDGDGPYVELMAGVFTDNQPDFSFLAPGEIREFSQYWYPISRIGVPLHATTAAALAVRGKPSGLEIGVAAPATHVATIRILHDAITLDEREVMIGPDEPALYEVATSFGVDDVVVEVVDRAQTLARWVAPDDPEAWREPHVATEPPEPEQIATADELYVTGLHLAQYRHPTRDPEPYWREALARDAGDARSLIALASGAYRRGKYNEATDLCQRAISRLTMRNANPPDTEAFYRLGLALVRLGREQEAQDAFGRAEWAAAWAPPARLEQARIDVRAGRYAEGLDRVSTPNTDPRVAAVRVVALRKHGLLSRSVIELQEARQADPRDLWLRHLDGQPIGDDARTLIDVAIELRTVGETTAAADLLRRATRSPSADRGVHAAIVWYLLADTLDRSDQHEEAAQARHAATASDPDLCFPSGLEEFDALVAALAVDASDATALDLLGIWLYDAGRREEALSSWRAAYHFGARRPVLLRNLALATATVGLDENRAAELYDEAIAQDRTRARLLLERDMLGRRLGESAERRLARLEDHRASAAPRDDLVVIGAELLTEVGRPDAALELLSSRQLRAWEGGEGLTLAAWDRACLALARHSLAAGLADEALAWTDRLRAVPESLGEQRHEHAPLAEAHFVRGEVTGDPADWQAGVHDVADPVAHSERPADDATYFVGRCALALRDFDRAECCWSALEVRAAQLRSEPDKIDYFATSVPALSLFGFDPAGTAARAERLAELAADGRSRAAALVGDA
jgi:tetratricopeptide (TPR) repeat protein